MWFNEPIDDDGIVGIWIFQLSQAVKRKARKIKKPAVDFRVGFVEGRFALPFVAMTTDFGFLPERIETIDLTNRDSPTY
jgi:hypothetical protein